MNGNLLYSVAVFYIFPRGSVTRENIASGVHSVKYFTLKQTNILYILTITGNEIEPVRDPLYYTLVLISTLR